MSTNANKGIVQQPHSLSNQPQTRNHYNQQYQGGIYPILSTIPGKYQIPELLQLLYQPLRALSLDRVVSYPVFCSSICYQTSVINPIYLFLPKYVHQNGTVLLT